MGLIHFRVVFLVALVGSGAFASGQKCECGVENLKTRIIDGHAAESGRYPWMASVLIVSGNTMASCGGSLINDRYILTAAHCMKSLKDVSQLKVTLGAHTSTDRQRISALEIEEVITHPDWISFDDISLIKLKHPITDVSPVCLPSFTEYDNLFVTGWGMTGSSGNSLLSRAQELMEVDTDEVDVQECKRKHFPQVNPEKEICAGGKGGGSCMGDSGGPLQTRKNGRVYQVGIVSFGPTDCATVTNAPNVYERVTGQMDWIKKNTADANWCDGPEQALSGKGSSSPVPAKRPSKAVPKPTTTPRPTAQRPTFVTIPDRKPTPTRPTHPVRPATSGGSRLIITRPGGATQIISSTSDDPFEEIDKIMGQSGFRPSHPSKFSNDPFAELDKMMEQMPHNGRKVIVKYPTRTVVSSSSSNGDSERFEQLKREMSRMFI